jgi:3-deoxy-D-manno-octulosonic-acid transferase
MIVYSSLLLAAMVLGAPYWLFRMAFSGRYRAGLAGRLGRIPKGLRESAADRDVIWIHAVSVGEVLAATRLIRELQAALPGWVIAVSTTTETGQQLAKQRLPESQVFYLPLDFAFTVRRYLKALQPQMLVLIESELWPRLIVECENRGIPIAVANARISDRSFPRYMRLRQWWRPFLLKISLYLAQSRESAERLIKIGAPSDRVDVTGNLKYDVQSQEATNLTKRVGSLVSGTRLIVAGSTLAGEEEALLAAWPTVRNASPNATLLIAPRHPDRFDEVLGLVRRHGHPVLRCSQLPLDAASIEGGTILLLDTIGDLASIYGIAEVAFVGGSLVPKGGHNPLEPAQFAVPVVMGPSFENFREIVQTMQEANAIRIVTPEMLTNTLIAMLEDTPDAKALGERGRAVFEAQAGATLRTAQALTALLKGPVTLQ